MLLVQEVLLYIPAEKEEIVKNSVTHPCTKLKIKSIYLMEYSGIRVRREQGYFVRKVKERYLTQYYMKKL